MAERGTNRPSEKNLDVLIGKLDVDGDGFIPLEDIKTLIEGEGLGVSSPLLQLAESLFLNIESAPDYIGRRLGWPSTAQRRTTAQILS